MAERVEERSLMVDEPSGGIKIASPTPDRSIAKRIKTQSEKIESSITSLVPDEISREAYPDLPVDSLLFAVGSIAKKKLDRLQEIRERESDPETVTKIGVVMTNLLHGVSKQQPALLEGIEREVDEVLIERHLRPKKNPEENMGFTYGRTSTTPIFSRDQEELQPAAEKIPEHTE